MACTPFKSGNVTGIICTGRQPRRKPPCDSCGRPSSHQCDYPVKRNGKQETCDRHLCNSCARPVDALGQDIDFCPAHWSLYEKNGRKLAL